MDEAEFGGQTILVGIDGSANAVSAFAWAVGEARLRNAELEAIYVWQTSGSAYGSPTYVPISEADVEAEAQAAFAEAVTATAGADDVKIRLRATSGSAVQVLRHAAADPGVGLVVVGSRGHGLLGRLLLGSVSLGLAHQCTKPLVIVPRDWSSGELHVIPPNVVVGIDGSGQSDRVLQWALREGACRETAVKAVMVGPSGATATLQAIIDRVDGEGADVEAVAVPGRPAPTLMDLAGRAQLLVVGRRGLGWAREKIRGSVSRECAEHASIPVVIVPPTH
jgi:nucleotide-binding universal stress UspA family protein